MITNNFKKVIQLILTHNNQAKGYTPAKDINNTTVYIGASNSGFPNTQDFTCRIANPSSNPGIYVGTGSNAASADDYSLQTPITSGLSAGNTTLREGIDESGNPYVEATFLLTNNSENDITVSEIGYIQTVVASTSVGGNLATYARMLIDRTVLDIPVTIPVAGEAVIKYTLKTIV